MAEATCPVCTNPLPVTPHGGSPRRYCSQKCRYLAKNRARRKSTTAPRCTAHPDCSRPVFARAMCNAHYWQWFTHGDPLAAEPEPKSSQWFVTHRGATLCSTKCRTERNRRQRQSEEYRERFNAARRAAYIPVDRKAEGDQRVVRARIYRRDGYRCQLCGKPLKRDALVPHPLAPVLDHIVPLAQGGRHSPENVQAAHFLCNSIKSDGTAPHGDQLRLIG